MKLGTQVHFNYGRKSCYGVVVSVDKLNCMVTGAIDKNNKPIEEPVKVLRKELDIIVPFSFHRWVKAIKDNPETISHYEATNKGLVNIYLTSYFSGIDSKYNEESCKVDIKRKGHWTETISLHLERKEGKITTKIESRNSGNVETMELVQEITQELINFSKSVDDSFFDTIKQIGITRKALKRAEQKRIEEENTRNFLDKHSKIDGKKVMADLIKDIKNTGYSSTDVIQWIEGSHSVYNSRISGELDGRGAIRFRINNESCRRDVVTRILSESYFVK